MSARGPQFKDGGGGGAERPPEETDDGSAPPPDAGGFGQELGGDPAGDAGRSTGGGGGGTAPPPSEGGPLPEGVPSEMPAREGVDADPTATTNVTRGELLGTEQGQQFLDETGLRPDEVRFEVESGIGGGRKEFSARPTEAGRRRLAAEEFEGEFRRGRTERAGEMVLPTGQLMGATADVDLGPGDVSAGEQGQVQLTPEAQERVESEFEANMREFFGGPSPETTAGRVSGAAAASSAVGTQREAQRDAAAAQLSGAAAASSAAGDRDPTPGLTEAVEEGEGFLAGFGVDIPQFEQEPGPPGARDGQQPAGTERVELGDLFGVEFQRFGEREPTAGRGAGRRERLGAEPVTLFDGPVVQDLGEERDFGSAIGGQELAIFGDREVTPGPRAGEREVVDTVTVDEALATFGEDVRFVDEGKPAFTGVEEQPGRAGAARAQEAEMFTGVGFEEAQAGSRAAIEAPGIFGVGAAQLGVGLADFGVEAAERGVDLPAFGAAEPQPGPRAGQRQQTAGFGFDPGGVGNLFGEAAEAGVNQAALFAEQGIQEPGITAAETLGTLGASAFIFGGAAAIGPRASLATRAAIQPGEEAAGFGGFGLTRRIAGERTAQRFFPNREPLIFSEEAAIRGLRAAGGRARAGGAAVRGRLPTEADFDVEAPFGELGMQAEIERGRAREQFREPRLAIEPLDQPFINLEATTEDIGPSGPLPFTGFEAEVEPAAETEVAADEFTGEGAGLVGGGGFDLEFEQFTGTGQAEVMRMTVPREMVGIETETEFPSELAIEQRRRFETTMGPFDGISEFGLFGEGVLQPELAQPAGIEDLFGEGFEQFGEFRNPFDLEFEQEPGREFEFEQEFEREVELEMLLALEAEAEQELEAEQEAEAEAELEVERRRLRELGQLGPFGTPPTAPAGQQFENPLASGAQFLFGRSVDDLGTQTPFEDLGEDAGPVMNLFTGDARDG